VLRACEKANPHGAGVAWREQGKVRWFKNLSAEDVIALLPDLTGEVVIHFRLASVGGVDPFLCHPFPITPIAPLSIEGKALRVLFHNGTWHEWESGLEQLDEDSIEGPLSDSRVMAMLLSGVIKQKELRTISGRWVLFGAKTTRVYGKWKTWQGMNCSNLGFLYEMERELRNAWIENAVTERRRKRGGSAEQLGLRWEPIR